MKASALAIAATLGLSLGAQAQGTYPEKPVRIIVDCTWKPIAEKVAKMVQPAR